MFKLATLCLGLAAALSAGPVLWTVGPDGLGIPNQLTRIDAGSQTVTPVVTLGSGATGFGGGLIAKGGSFAGLQSDSSANVSPVLFDQAGNLNGLPPLGQFLPGGMAEAGGVAYLIRNDATGDSFLTNGLLSMPLGQGFTGGLAYRETDGLFYAVQNSNSGDSLLYAIDVANATTTALPLLLGQGFYGGLAWNPANDVFFAIGSDAAGTSSLYQFALTDSTPALLFGIGQGFVNAALALESTAVDPPLSAVPEPGTGVLTVAGVLLLWRFRRRI